MAQAQNKHPNIYLIQPSKNLLRAHYSPGTVPGAGYVGEDNGETNYSSSYHILNAYNVPSLAINIWTHRILQTTL